MSKKLTAILLILLLALNCATFGYFYIAGQKNDAKLAAITGELDAEKATSGSLSARLTAAETAAAELTAQTQADKAASDTEIAALKAQLADAETAAAELTAQTQADKAATDTEIAELKAQLADAETAAAELTTQTQADKAASDAEIAALKAQLADADAQLASLSAANAALNSEFSDVYYYGGVSYLATLPDVAEQMLIKAYENGDRRAALTLGTEYLDGIHIGKDLGKAATYLRAAEDAGLDGTDLLLGRLCLETGDTEQALTRLTSAAEAGDREAYLVLGGAYVSDAYGLRDMAKALVYYEGAETLAHDDATQATISTLKTYVQAETQLAAGGYEKAAQLFESISGSFDADARARDARYLYAGRLYVTGYTDESWEQYSALAGYRDVDAILADTEFWCVSARMELFVADEYGNEIFTYNEPVGYLNDLEDGQRFIVRMALTNSSGSAVDVALTTDEYSWNACCLAAGATHYFIIDNGDTDAIYGKGEHEIKWYVNGREKLEGSYTIVANGTSAQKKAAASSVAALTIAPSLSVYRSYYAVSEREPNLALLETDEYITLVFNIANTGSADASIDTMSLVLDGEALSWYSTIVTAGSAVDRRIGEESARELLTAGTHAYTLYINGIAVAAGSAEIVNAAPEAAPAAVETGSYITYGNYPQGENGEVEPIEWLVLEVQDDKALVISRYGLDAQPYNTENADITWENCSLRTWLNVAFLNTAFTADEQKAILSTYVDNSAAQCLDFTAVATYAIKTTGGNDTQDRIFLLSYAEANKYFGVQFKEADTGARVHPTAYACKQGATASKSYPTADCATSGWWWLRSPGNVQADAAVVGYTGVLGYVAVWRNIASVRPAFWISLDALK